MGNGHDIDPQDELDARAPSKSARKREMHALQRLGESLVALSDKQLRSLPIEDERLLVALEECQRIRSNSARKRHMQLIGKLMRDIDAAPIEKAMNELHQSHSDETLAFQSLETLRADILAAGQGGVELAVQRFPAADRQHVRQLVLQHQRETTANKPPAASRKLFRYLRELQAGQS
ncbi:MAG: DUF615 domain-containing protein [Gammaproteobacteria bacterium]|nr:DUF615 domain-containing protein [Gammaproteobacteria bacterium]